MACGHGYQQRQVKCQTHDNRLSTHCHKAYRPVSKQNCRGQRCNEGANDPLPTDDKCVDINKVAYCPLGTDLNKISTGIETVDFRLYWGNFENFTSTFANISTHTKYRRLKFWLQRLFLMRNKMHQTFCRKFQNFTLFRNKVWNLPTPWYHSADSNLWVVRDWVKIVKKVHKFNFCNRAYFRKMCCKTCRGLDAKIANGG